MDQEINAAAEALKAGKVILYPTDTIWGLGCDATNSSAVQHIFKIKKRDDSKALIILLDDLKKLNDYVVKVPDIAWDIVEFSEMPLTVVYPKGKNVAQELLAENGSIAIRVTKDEFCKKLIRKLGRPLVSTSANISTEAFNGSFSDVNEEIKKNVDLIIRHRQQEKINATPSRIISLGLDGEIKFIRK
ncbi:MAG TPA: L-threonylcarbamoyladenylate synthase [Cytophagaceae bacterium]|jgi:L-threonylcarbamoyladenylate synthase|nr:L-threonylcarbamoyladenylate synthase [Cytophagaceae bacterium]